MNSRDPWSVIVTDRHGGIVVPGPQYGHPFYREVPSWIHYDDPASAGTTRALFEGTFVSGWHTTGDNMTDILGAELTALSAPGYGFRPWYRPFYGGYPYVLGAELTALSAPGYGFRPWYGYPYGAVYVGAAAEAQLPKRSALTAEVAPIVAPATGGVLVEKHLDDKQVLHVRICVDGQCYSTSMDLAPAIAMVMQKLARWQTPKPPPGTVVSTVETAVGVAEEALVGALIAQHIDVVSAGWLDSIKSGFTKVVNTTLKLDVFGVHRVASGLVKKLKTPITLAATAVATAYGGPLAGAAAAKLVGPIIDQTAEFGKKKNPQVAAAEQAAKTDPVAAKALKSAQDAVAQSIAAHHVKETAQQAAAGDPTAQRKIVDVAQDVEKGDPAAKAVASLISEAMKSEQGAKLWTRATGRGPGTVSPATGAWPWWP